MKQNSNLCYDLSYCESTWHIVSHIKRSYTQLAFQIGPASSIYRQPLLQHRLTSCRHRADIETIWNAIWILRILQLLFMYILYLADAVSILWKFEANPFSRFDFITKWTLEKWPFLQFFVKFWKLVEYYWLMSIIPANNLIFQTNIF